MENGIQTPKLRRVLGLPAVVFIAIGFTIGGGVFVFTGIAYKMAGQALPVAYALAVLPVFLSMMPLAMLGSAIPTVGGNYKYPSRMVSPGLAFVGIWVYALASFFGQIPLYALGCARYAQYYFPTLSPTLFAVALVTLFFIINLLGIRLAAQIQGLLVIILISALVYYFLVGFEAIRLSHFHNIFDKGTSNLVLGTALLTFTYFGSNGIIELGGEIKNPGRTIPRAFFIAFPIIAVIYISVAIATVGAASPAELTDAAEPLIRVIQLTGSRAGALFFVFCGAILALTTTLNALYMVGTKSLLMMVVDGILPSALGKLHHRFRTPYILLTGIWLLSILGVVSGFSLETLASYAALGGLIIFLPIQLAAIRFRNQYPRHYRDASFKLTGFFFWICPLAGILMVLFFGMIILYDLKSLANVGSFVLFIFSGLLYYSFRKKYLRKRGIDLVESVKGQRRWDD
jgi:APA family basic amino acid/polyamine antiporter